MADCMQIEWKVCQYIENCQWISNGNSTSWEKGLCFIIHLLLNIRMV